MKSASGRQTEGLRCCYQGWLYDTHRQCVEMPCETNFSADAWMFGIRPIPRQNMAGWYSSLWDCRAPSRSFRCYDIIDTRTPPDERASDLCRGAFYGPARQGRRRINLWSGSGPRGGIARSDSSGSSMGKRAFYSLVLPSTKAARAVRRLFTTRSSLTAPFTFVMHLAQTMLQSFSLLTIGRGVSQPFVELAFLVPKALTMLPPLAIAFPPLRGRRGGLGHSGYRYRNRNLNVGLPWGRRLCIDHRREGACEQKRGEHGKAGLHGGSYPVSNDQ